MSVKLVRTVEIPTVPTTNIQHSIVLNTIDLNSESGLCIVRQRTAFSEHCAHTEQNGSAVECVEDRTERVQHCAVVCIDVDIMRLEVLRAFEDHAVG